MTEWSRADTTSLRRAVLDATALVPLIQADADRAAEAILAAVLEEPRGDRGGFDLRMGIGIVERIDAVRALPESGPMLAFLMHAPDTALRTILQIVEHATRGWENSDWTDVADDGIAAAFEVVLDGDPVPLSGNGNVMHWYRGDARVPVHLASALMAVEQFLYRKLDAGEDIDPVLATLMTSRSVAVFGVLVAVACYHPALLQGPLAPLATSAGLILADRLYKPRDHGYLMMALGDLERARLRAWHTMPHRRVPIDQHIMPLVVGDGPLADVVAEARQRWAKHPDDRWRFLRAQLDPANYRPTELSDGARAWDFTMPPELMTEIETDQRDLDDRRWWLTAPMRFAQLLAEGAMLTEAAAAELWADIDDHLSRQPPENLFDDGVLRRADVECGGAAVLLTLAPAWTERELRVMEFCRRVVVRPFIEPPPTHQFDSPLEPTEMAWDGFAAVALPALWHRDPRDRELREVAVRLSIHRHLGAVQQFFAAATGYPELSDDVRRLEVVALHWARFASWVQQRRHRESVAAHWAENRAATVDLPDLEAPTQAVLEGFVDATLQLDAPSLQEFIQTTPDGLIPAAATGRMRIAHALDVSYLLAAWAHVLTLPSDIDHSERDRRLAVAAQFASTFAAALVPDERGLVDGTPSEEERSLHARLGAMVVNADAASARRVWEPILAVGTPAHYWVSDFIDEVWVAALADQNTPARHAELIKAMMAFAKSKSSWSGWHRDALDLALLCLGRFGYPRMEDRHRPLLDALQPEWSELAAANMRSSYTARPIVNFLGEPISAGLVDAGMGWLAERERAGATPDDDLDAAMAEMLSKLAGREPGLFRRLQAARDVLAALVARQNPVALQLSASLGGST